MSAVVRAWPCHHRAVSDPGCPPWVSLKPTIHKLTSLFWPDSLEVPDALASGLLALRLPLAPGPCGVLTKGNRIEKAEEVGFRSCFSKI